MFTTTNEDYKPNGKRRTNLCIVIPLMQKMEGKIKDEDFSK